MAIIGILLLLISIPLPFAKRVSRSTIYLCDVVFLVIFTVWLPLAVFTGWARLKGKKIFLSFLPLLIAGMISGLNAKDVFRYVGYLYLYAQIPFAYLMTTDMIKSRRHLNLILYVIFMTTALFSFSYIFSYLHTRYLSIDSLKALTYFYGGMQKNIRAAYIGIGLPLFFGAIFLHQRRHLKILLSILMGICFTALVLTASRGGIFSTSVGLLFLILLFMFIKDKDKGNIKRILFYIILLYLAGFIYVCFFDKNLSFFMFKKGVSAFWPGRRMYYKVALELFKQHPIIGIGMGNYLSHARVIHPHSMLMQILSEAGILGMAGFLFLLWKLIEYLKTSIRLCKDRYQYIIWAATASLLCFFVNNIPDFTLGHGIGIQLGIILAIIDSSKQNVETSRFNSSGSF